MGLRVLDGEESLSKIKKIVAVAAGKGGVGKSTVTAALALASALRGLKVGVLDADVYGPSIPLLLPDTTQVSTHLDKIIPAKSHAIQTLSITHFGITDTSTAFRAPVVNMFIQQCIHQVFWGDLDILYVDFPPGVGDVHLCLLQEWAFTGAILVTMPNKLSQSDVEKAGDSFVEMGVPISCVIENFSGVALEGISSDTALFGNQTGKLIQDRYQAPLLEKVPLDPRFSTLLNSGENPFLESRLRGAAERFMSIESTLFEELALAKAPSPLGQTLVWRS
ncbi:MAG: P-loop NTPase [Chlamydiia bacterium]